MWDGRHHPRRSRHAAVSTVKVSGDENLFRPSLHCQSPPGRELLIWFTPNSPERKRMSFIHTLKRIVPRALWPTPGPHHRHSIHHEYQLQSTSLTTILFWLAFAAPHQSAIDTEIQPQPHQPCRLVLSPTDHKLRSRHQHSTLSASGNHSAPATLHSQPHPLYNPHRCR